MKICVLYVWSTAVSYFLLQISGKKAEHDGYGGCRVGIYCCFCSFELPLEINKSPREERDPWAEHNLWQIPTCHYPPVLLPEKLQKNVSLSLPS